MMRCRRRIRMSRGNRMVMMLVDTLLGLRIYLGSRLLLKALCHMKGVMFLRLIDHLLLLDGCSGHLQA